MAPFWASLSVGGFEMAGDGLVCCAATAPTAIRLPASIRFFANFRDDEYRNEIGLAES